ncbi:helix-turn-helix transcriptional regulator [Amycolatopsis japonica]|uniref:helix-turn-helix domain-containing protein n=1 Tax=Amycolatopsis japonica TaxID=208439 RepID=UPI0036720760
MRRKDSLSPTELEILKEIARGLDYREIATKSFRSIETIRTHAKSILYKLRARNRTHAVAIAYHVGIFQGIPTANARASAPLALPTPDISVRAITEQPIDEAQPDTTGSSDLQESSPDNA